MAVGRGYPGSVDELPAGFGTDTEYRDYLGWPVDVRVLWASHVGDPWQRSSIGPGCLDDADPCPLGVRDDEGAGSQRCAWHSSSRSPALPGPRPRSAPRQWGAGRPGRGSSTRPSSRRSKKRRHCLATVCVSTPRRAAAATLISISGPLSRHEPRTHGKLLRELRSPRPTRQYLALLIHQLQRGLLAVQFFMAQSLQ